MKAKIIGVVVLLVTIIGATVYYFYGKTTDVTEINGYLGGEKIGIMEDEEIQKIFKKSTTFLSIIPVQALWIWLQLTRKERTICFLQVKLLLNFTRKKKVILFQMT